MTNEAIETTEEGQEKAKPTTYEAIGVQLVEDPPNGEVVRDIRVKGTDKKFSVRLAIPTTDEEAQEWYACSIEDLLKKGVVQKSYDSDNAVRNFLDEKTAADEDPADYVEEFAAEFAEALAAEKAPRKRGGTAKAEREAGKKTAQSAKKIGLTPEQMIAIMEYQAENPSATMTEAREALGFAS